MCGIFGYIGQTPFDRKNLKILALYNEDRGEDSIGIYNHIYSEDKFESKISKYNTKSRNTEFLKGSIEETQFFIGHTRNKSIGSFKLENVHPFHFEENICGVHNGTIRNYEELAEKYDVKPGKNDSDSKVLYEILGKTGGNFNVLGDIEGTAALAFTLGDEKLYLFRKDGQRPIWISRFVMDDTGEKALYFSSLKESLESIEVPDDSIKYIEPGHVYEFDINTDKLATYEVEDNKDKPTKQVQTISRTPAATRQRNTDHGRSYTERSKSHKGTKEVDKKQVPGISRVHIPLNDLKYKYIEGDEIKNCVVFRNGYETWTRYVLESGAIAVIKGDNSYNISEYNKETALSVMEDRKCEARDLDYNLLTFENGSFIEIVHPVSDVHSDETDTEEGFSDVPIEEETWDDDPMLDSLYKLWHFNSSIGESVEAAKCSANPQIIESEIEDIEDYQEGMRKHLTVIQQELLERESQ